MMLFFSACDNPGNRSCRRLLAVRRPLMGKFLGVASPYDADITLYRVPYAAPPVDELRWQPPQPPIPWHQPRIADRFAASRYQQRHVSTFVWRREDFEVSEDCLYLNVWTPREGADLPVMVWFHGGSHTSGQGHSLIFDGTSLASQGVWHDD